MRKRGFPAIPTRRGVQAAFFVLVVAIGIQFAVWAAALRAGASPPVPRPAGVEGFLPISALMSLRLWLGGQGVHGVHPAALAILVAVLAMSTVFAKSFCSLLCPVGALSEWLGRVGRRLLGHPWQPPRWLDVPLRALKYVLLAFFLWATWVALDPAGVRAFLDSPYHRVADVKMLLFFARASDFTVGVLGVLAVGSVLLRDPWCRYLCPYGALLGLLGRLAPLKVTRDAARCTDCRRCTGVCPARLPVHALARVASVECTSCQDCVAVCPVSECLAIRPPAWRGLGRRLRPAAAVVGAVAVWLAIVGVFRVAGHWHSVVAEAEYARRVAEIDSPTYDHVGEIDAAGAPATPPPLEGSHGRF